MLPSRKPKEVLAMMKFGNLAKLESWVYELEKRSIISKSQEFIILYNHAKFISTCRKLILLTLKLQSRTNNVNFEDLFLNKKFLNLLQLVIDLSFKQIEDTNVNTIMQNDPQMKEIFKIINTINDKFTGWQASKNPSECIKTLANLTEKLMSLKEPNEFTQEKHGLLAKARQSNQRAVELLELILYAQDCGKSFIATLMSKAHNNDKQQIRKKLEDDSKSFFATMKKINVQVPSEPEKVLEEIVRTSSRIKENISNDVPRESIKKSLKSLFGIIRGDRGEISSIGSQDSTASFIKYRDSTNSIRNSFIIIPDPQDITSPPPPPGSPKRRQSTKRRSSLL